MGYIINYGSIIRIFGIGIYFISYMVLVSIIIIVMVSMSIGIVSVIINGVSMVIMLILGFVGISMGIIISGQ